MSLEYCDLSDIGRRRSNNQDSRAVVEPWSREQYRRRGWLFVVADGMGAHAAGEMASDLAVKHVHLAYEKMTQRSPPLALRSSIEHANAEIHARGQSSPDLEGMGTTCTAMVIVPRGAIVGHVGDSRAYRVRGGRIEQLSKDHSLVWEMEAARGGTVDDTAPPIPKNIITRSMGPHPEVAVDIEGPFPVEVGDVFVLCSDGLSGQVADEEIGFLAGALPPKQAAATLVGLALVRGAPDNVTVIVARAGEKEASRTSSRDEPWPLTDEAPAARRPAALPWPLLAAAATSLFGSLVLFPNGELMRDTGPLGGLLGELRVPVAWITFGMLLLGFVIALVAALIGFLSPAQRPIRVLAAGARLGGGPYRSYDCGPTPQLLEGLVASAESAADGLAEAERTRTLAFVSRARKHIASREFPRAVAAAAEAIAVYARSVEASRRSG